MTTTIITWPKTAPTPAGAQPRWGIATAFRLRLDDAREVGRIPSKMPIPDGASAYTDPVVTDDLRALVRAQIQAIADGDGDPLFADLARSALADDEYLDRVVAANLGLAHPYATCAPWTVESLDEACDAMVRAQGLWTSPCSSAVIRTAQAGYDVWTGIGSMLDRAGRADDLGPAETMAIDAVWAKRRVALAEIRQILADWSPHTPYYSATLETAADALPIIVRRGPMTSEEGPGSSWDLPIVMRWQDGEIERHDDRVTWDDEASRRRAALRQQEGEARARAKARQACRMLRRNPRLAGLVRDHDLVPTEITLQNDMVVRTVGPVRLRDDGREALALVRERSLAGLDGPRFLRLNEQWH